MSILVIRFQAVNRSMRISDGLSSEACVFFMICVVGWGVHGYRVKGRRHDKDRKVSKGEEGTKEGRAGRGRRGEGRGG